MLSNTKSSRVQLTPSHAHLLLALFNNGYRLLWLGTSFSSEDFNLDARTDKVLTSVHEPLDGGNDEDDSKCCNTVVCCENQVSQTS